MPGLPSVRVREVEGTKLQQVLRHMQEQVELREPALRLGSYVRLRFLYFALALALALPRAPAPAPAPFLKKNLALSKKN